MGGGGPLRDWRVGDGVLKMLSAGLGLFFLILIQHKITAARIRAAPRMDPRTMPAMAPPESPDREVPCPAPPLADGTLDDVLDGNRGGIETVVGRSTFAQRLSTFAVTQHESVELMVLSAQNMQSPRRLPW